MDQQDVIDYEEWLDEQHERDLSRNLLRHTPSKDGSALLPPEEI